MVEREKVQEIFKPKFFTLLREGISKEQIVTDVFAGVIVGIVALPLAIAFAVASGVSPEKGLITAIVAGFVISLLGGSRVQIGGPTGAFIVILYGIVHQYGIDGLLISTMMAGVFLVLFGMLKLGSLLKYFPHPLIVGFTSGIALVIFSTQIKNALGLDIDKLPSDFLSKLEIYIKYFDTINFYALGITLFTILTVVYSKHFFKKIPGSFIAVVVTTLAVHWFDLPVTTIETFFGDISNEISFSIPHFEFSDIVTYLKPALVIALLGSIESLLSAVVADGMIGGNHRSNTELIAQGIANIVTPFFGGIPATGAIARTATNIKNGARTPISGMVHSLTLLLIMLFFIDYAKLIPMATLSGILIVVSYNMSEWRSFLSILKSSHFDSIVLVSVFFLTVLVDLTVAIEVGVVLSSLLFMKRMSDINTDILKESNDEVIEDYSDLPDTVSVYEIGGPLFFASAKQYAQTIKEIGEASKILVLRMRYVPFIDSTALHNLKDTITFLQDAGVKIVISGIAENVYKDLKKAEVIDMIGEENIFRKFPDAVEYIKRKLI